LELHCKLNRCYRGLLHTEREEQTVEGIKEDNNFVVEVVEYEDIVSDVVNIPTPAVRA